MEIAVVGIGGASGYYGGLLSRRYSDEDGVDIIFIARGKHLLNTRKQEGNRANTAINKRSTKLNYKKQFIYRKDAKLAKKVNTQ